MTLSTLVSRVSYPGAGSTGPFAIPFKFFGTGPTPNTAPHLLVTKRSAIGVETTLTVTTDYTVTGAGDATGTLTLIVALAAGETLVIRRKPPLDQPMSIRNQGAYFPATIEDEDDRLVMQLQDLQDQLNRSIKLKETIAGGPTLVELDPTNGYAVTGTGSGFTMSPISAGAVALPGEGRTTTTLSAYLANNALYNPMDYSAVGNGAAADAAAVALTASKAALTNGILILPAGKTFRIDTNQTIPSNVTVMYAGGRVSVDVNKTLSVNGPLIVGRVQWILGAGQVSFRNGVTGFAIGIDAVFPEWWGAFADPGAGPLTDCGPGLQSAVRSGSRRISLTEGVYTLRTQVLVNEDPTAPNDLLIEGITRTGTYILFGPAGGVYAGINAGFVNKQNNGKLSFRRVRFSGSGFSTPAFAGWGIWALEDGTNSQTIFSGAIDYCWIGLGQLAIGFLYGGINNYYVSNCTTEAMKERFYLVGNGISDIHFENIAEYSCLGPFLDMATDAVRKNTVSIVGLHAFNPQDRVLIRANNCESLMLADITYQQSDPVIGGTLGLLDLTGCQRLQISDVKATRYPGSLTNMVTVIKMVSCTGRIDNLYVDGGTTQVDLSGALDLDFTATTLIHADAFHVRFTAVTTGRVRFNGSRLQYSLNAGINYQVGGSSNDVILEDTDLLDPLYGAGVAGYGSYFVTTGRVRMIGGRLGRTTNIAAGTAWAATTAYVEGDMRSDGGVNYIARVAHTSSVAGAGGNEPGVGATWANFWWKHVSNVNAYLYPDAATGTFAIEGTELIDTSVLLRHAASTQVIKSQRWLNAIQNQSADKGDANVTITQWTDPETVRFATVLTANRTVTLAWIAGTVGKFRVVRTGLGAFTLDVGGLKTIPAGTAAFVDVEYDGATARLTGYGPL